MELLLAFLLLLVAYTFNWYLTKPKNLPPGSAGLPVVGYLPFLKIPVHKQLSEVAKKYGGIFHLYLGNTLVIYFHDYAVLREAYGRQGDAFPGKYFTPFLSESQADNLGVATTEGAHWVQHRRFAMKTLRDHGVGKAVLEPRLLDEMTYLVHELEKHIGQKVNVLELLTRTFMNNILMLISGQRFSYDDPKVGKVLHNFEAFNHLVDTWSVPIFMPWLTWIPGISFALKLHHKRSIIGGILDTVSDWVEEAKGKAKAGESNNYIETYISAMATDSSLKTFSKESLVHSSRDLLQGGTETSATILTFLLLYMAKYQDIQRRVQDEIDQRIGSDREPSLADRLRTPYCDAVICEVQRIVTLIPIISHKNPKPVSVLGYDIPAGAMSLGNLWATHHDPKLWGDPENFRPDRFLAADGRVVTPPYFLPFGLGKRQCLGEALAKMEIYLSFICLMQKFNFLPVQGVTPEIHVNSSFIHVPAKPIICPISRSQPM